MGTASRIAATGALFAAVSLTIAGTAAAMTGQKVVKSGEVATLFQHSTYLREACTAGPVPTLQITTQPRHGTVSIDRGAVKVKGGSCDGMSFPGVRVIYKSAPGYHGPDVVAFETKAPLDTTGIRMMTDTRVFELTVR